LAELQFTLMIGDDLGGARADRIRLTFTGLSPGETVTFVADVDADNVNSTEDYRRVLFNNGDAPNAVATAFAKTASCSASLPDAADASSYRLACVGGGSGNGALGFTFDVFNDANTPTLRVTNTSSGMLQLTEFEVTIGDTAFNFDSVTDIVAPAGTGVTLESPDDNDSGGVRADLVRLAFTAFDPGESVTFVVDIDRDDSNTLESFRRVLFNNGDAPNAVATAFSGDESCSVTLGDADDSPTYRFECGSLCPGIEVGLVAYYPLDGNAIDATGNGWDGTLFGATPTVDRDGNANGAIAFDGVGNYIEIPYASALQPTTVTLGLWAQRDDWAAASFDSDAAIAGNTDTGGYEFFVDRSAGEIQAYVRSKSGSYVVPSVPLSTLAPGWHHFTLTSDGVNTIFYVDGKAAASDSTGTGIVRYARNNSFIIGEEASAGTVPDGDNFAGRIDDVRIYRRALCAEEVRELAIARGTAGVRITRIARDRATHAIILNWEPGVDSGVVERSANLKNWETLVNSVSGTTWTGVIPGNPRETYLRVRVP
jgi:hypothetical protein